MNSSLEARVRLQLQQIHPVTLQKLAEDMACIKFPERFGRHVLRRSGRNDEDQTTKGWPDAFVSTGDNEVDGIEATRQAQTWASHLEADLTHAKDPHYRKLSGYFFVGGYPGEKPTRAQIDSWIDRFVEAGAQRTKVTILVGSDLVLELCRPEYAAVRQLHLGLLAVPKWFRLMGQDPINNPRLGPFQPTQDEYDNGLVSAPEILDQVITDLISRGWSAVRGYGAAGKTTLAELVARHYSVAPNPTWYIDLANPHEDAAPLNEMAELAAHGVLFVIDNLHIDPDYASRIQEYWNRHLSLLGSRVLFLGRLTSRNPLHGFPLEFHELRAGIAEMLSVTARLAARVGSFLPEIPLESIQAWARIFGGSYHIDKIAVDLIAFTAAADRRMRQIMAGDFRLNAIDAVEAMRERYLKSLKESHELENLLRLAAFAEFEVPLMSEQFPDPIVGLSQSINSLGLVIFDDLGLEGRRYYRLVHAGIGPLLLEAAGAKFNSREDRQRAITQSPGLGRRVSSWLRRNDPESDMYAEIDDLVLRVMSSPDWPNHSSSLYDLRSLVRFAIHKKIASFDEIDAAIIASKAIPRFFQNAPAVQALSQFLAYASKGRLSRAAAEVGFFAVQSSFLGILSTALPSAVADLIRVAPNGADILARIDVKSWNDAQGRSGSEPVSRTISACRFFEARKRLDLSWAPAARHVMLADPSLWDFPDPSFLSHILRFARPTFSEANDLLNALKISGWLATAIKNGSLGLLSGALLSLANYLDPGLKKFVLNADLDRRVVEELSAPMAERGKHRSRPICLLGGFEALGGQLRYMPPQDWSRDPQAEIVLSEVAHSESTGQVGMYELQLWLGLKALQRVGQGPAAVVADRGLSFCRRFEAASPPTREAALIQQNLLGWLKQIEFSGWRLK